MLRVTGIRAFVLTVTVACSGLALADQKYRAGSLEARDHGYEHGYRDGFHKGAEDRSHHNRFKAEVKDADAGYEKFMGSKDQYKEGFRSGFVAGYDDGFNNRSGRLSQLYGPYDETYRTRGNADRYDELYPEKGWSSSHLAADMGYRDGLAAGSADFEHHLVARPEEQRDFRDGDHGYRSGYGDRIVYQQQYRDSFLQGYRDGYNGTR